MLTSQLGGRSTLVQVGNVVQTMASTTRGASLQVFASDYLTGEDIITSKGRIDTLNNSKFTVDEEGWIDVSEYKEFTVRCSLESICGNTDSGIVSILYSDDKANDIIEVPLEFKSCVEGILDTKVRQCINILPTTSNYIKFVVKNTIESDITLARLDLYIPAEEKKIVVE